MVAWNGCLGSGESGGRALIGWKEGFSVARFRVFYQILSIPSLCTTPHAGRMRKR